MVNLQTYDQKAGVRLSSTGLYYFMILDTIPMIGMG
jgi:hypothetical protein